MSSDTLPFVRNVPLQNQEMPVVLGQPGYLIRVRGLMLSVGPLLSGPTGPAYFSVSGFADNTASDSGPGNISFEVTPPAPGSVEATNVCLDFGPGIDAVGPNQPILAIFQPFSTDTAAGLYFNIWGDLVPVS